MTWELTILKSENGFIMQYPEETEEGIRNCLEVIEDIDENEKEIMKRLLYRVADFFGLNHDKYKKDNLNITFDKVGIKVELDNESTTKE